MFNALNRFISRLDGDAPVQKAANQGGFGFQVLRNTNLDLAIEPWFDFIIGINSRMIVCRTFISPLPLLIYANRLIFLATGRLGPRLIRPGSRELCGWSRHVGSVERKGQSTRPPNITTPL